MEILVAKASEETHKQTHKFAELFMEFFELATTRTEADLWIQATTSDMMVKALEERLRCPKTGFYSELTLLSNVLISPLEEILDNPNIRLFRTRQMLPLSRVKQMDAACVRWLARQPGKTIEEKTGGKQRILAVQRRLTINTLENRVVKYLVEHLLLDALTFQPEEKLECEKKIKRFHKAVKNWQQFLKINEIESLKGIPAPNNSLRHDRDYRRIWLGTKRILSHESRIMGTMTRFPDMYIYLVAHIIGLSLSRCGLSPLDIGFMPNEDEKGFINFHNCCGVWLLDSGKRLGRYEIHIIDRHIKLLFIDSLISNNGINEIDFIHNLNESHIEVLTETNDIFSFSPDWNHMSDFVDSLSIYLNNILNLPPSGAMEQIGTLSDASSRPMVINICNDSLLLSDNVNTWDYPLFAGEVNVTNGKRLSRMVVTGKGARNLIIEHGWNKWLKADAHNNFRIGKNWLTHGHLWKALSNQVKMELSTALFRSSILHFGKYDGCVFVYPQYLQELAYHNLYSSLVDSGLNCLMIPQPVAAAFCFAKMHPEKIEPDGKYLFISLDGEKPDAGYLEYRNCIDNPNEGEWVRIFLRDELNAPSNLEWRNLAIRNACKRQGISPSKSQIARIYFNTSYDEMVKVGFGKTEILGVSFHEAYGKISYLEITNDDVTKAWKEYLRKFHKQLTSFLKRLKKHIKGFSLIISGKFIATAAEDNIFSPTHDPVYIFPEESIVSGARIFLERKKRGLPTWKDYLPKLELQVAGADGKPVWHSLFAEEKPIDVGKSIKGKEHHFIFPAGEKFVSLPLKKDGFRSSFDPVIRIKSPINDPIPVYMTASYHSAGAGLQLFYHSANPEIIAADFMNWERIPRVVSDEPEIFYRDSPSLAPVGFQEAINSFNNLFEGNFGKSKDATDTIKTAVKSIDEHLKYNLFLSETTPWENITSERTCMATLPKAISCLAYLLDLDMKNLSSMIFTTQSLKKLIPPSGEDANNLLARLRKDQRFNKILITCLGRLRLAAPNAFIEKLIVSIREQGFHERDNAAEYLRAAGRITGAYELSEKHQILIELLFNGISEFADKKSIDNSFRPWSWAIGTFLRSNQDAAVTLPVELSLKTFTDVLGLFKVLCESNIDGGTWRDFLFMFISFRHFTRAKDGKANFGPESALVKLAVDTLNKTNRLLTEQKLKIVNGINPQSLGIDNPEIFIKTDLLDQLSEIWQGKVTVLLKQERESV